MRNAIFLLCTVLMLSISSCQKSEIVKSVEGTYAVNGWQKSENGTSTVVSTTLQVKGVKSDIKVQFGKLTRKYVLVGEDENGYSFREWEGMNCTMGEDIITIGKQSDSISAWFWRGDYGYAAGVKIGN